MTTKNMSYYKPPSRRVRIFHGGKVGKPEKGSFLHGICTSRYTGRVTSPIRPVYKQDDYLKLLKKNDENLGIPHVPPNLPVYRPDPKPELTPEVELDVPDRVYIRLRILKNGIVRVKLNTSIWDLYNTYYRKAVKPPFKAVLQAYKSHGFSPSFLEKMKLSNEKHKRLAIHIDKVFTKIFDKEPTKKTKKEKKKPNTLEEETEEIKEVVEDEDIVPQSGDPEEEETLDVEPDEDVEPEEEYFSDGE